MPEAVGWRWRYAHSLLFQLGRKYHLAWIHQFEIHHHHHLKCQNLDELVNYSIDIVKRNLYLLFFYKEVCFYEGIIFFYQGIIFFTNELFVLPRNYLFYQ